MIKTVVHPVYGTIALDENIWTGKKSLSIRGQALTKCRKNTYSLTGEDDGILVTLKGSTVTGAKVIIRGEEIQICPKPSTLDWLLSAIPFILIMVWSMNPALCAIVPVVGGAIGGALGGLAVVLSITNIQEKPLGKKLLVSLLATLATFAVGAALGYVVVFAMVAATV